MERLRTARLQAEPLAADHLDFLVEVWQDPRVVATLGGPRSRNQVGRAVTAGLWHWDRFHFGWWIWNDATTGEPLGWCFLHHVTVEQVPEVELGYTVGRPHRWGEGLASEMAKAVLEVADGPLALDEVVAYTLPSNTGSRRVMEKVGFAYERPIVHADLDHVLYRRQRRR